MNASSMILLCSVDQIPLGLGRSFNVGGQNVGVFRNHAGQVFAVENRCPRKGGPLTDGMIVGDRILCPLHAYQYEDDDCGNCAGQSACAMKSFPVEVEAGTVRVSAACS